MAGSLPLAGRVALVTGSSQGIGRATALRLARDGAHCIVTYRKSEDLAREVVAEIAALGRRAIAVPLDLRDAERVPAVLGEVARAFGRLDILVASAAATAFRPMAEQKLHNLRATFAISVDGFVTAVQQALPLMEGRPGRIVAISGIDSHQAMTGHGALGAAKAAVESLVRTLALELGPRGITVNGVSPGFVETHSARTYVERGLGQAPELAMARVIERTPVRRVGTGDDIAAVVAFLASDDAGFVTGQTIIADGGLTIVSPLNALEEPS